jgi:hypothetical protein
MISTNTTIHAVDNSSQVNFQRFKPAAGDEAAVASIIRCMLQYHVLRTQLKQTRPWMPEKQRPLARSMATKIRLQGFAEERQAVEQGIRVVYDDQALCAEGARIAVAISRNEIGEAYAREEQAIEISVNHSLHGVELEAFDLAA